MNRQSTTRSRTLPDVVKHLAVVCMLVVTSCAHQFVAPLYNGAPTYPETEIALKGGVTLKHFAGRNCEDESRPEVGTSDRARTFSRYELTDLHGHKLCESPSGLSDPKYDGEFEGYNRKNDRIEIFQSESGRSLLIVEDRSPTFPRVALLLLQRDKDGHWKQRELLSPDIQGTPANIYGSCPPVKGITDSEVCFGYGKKLKSETFAKLQKPADS